ncbi:hypothetical protein K2X33_15170 [bacterium]|nr:hypothetical protein [bacterium]
MLRFLTLVSAITLAACAGAPGTQAPPGPLSGATGKVTVYSIGDRHGEVKPCGCPRVQLGGMTRLFAYADAHQAAQGTQFFADSGNSFFSLPTLPPTRQEDEKARAELIADAYRMLGVSALVPGKRDLTLGQETLRQLAERAGIALLAANLKDAVGKPVFTRQQVFERDGIKVGITGVVDAEAAWAPWQIDPNGAKDALRALKAQGAQLTVLMIQKAEQAGKYNHLGYDLELLAPVEEGKSVAYASWDLGTGKVTDSAHEELTPEWEKPGRFTAVYDRHLAQAKESTVGKAAAPVKTVKGAWDAQAHRCQECHAKQYDFWQGTKHASAYLVLFAKDQHFDPECISCHTLGYGSSKGFTDIASPLRRAGEAPRKAGEMPFVEGFFKDIFSEDTGKGALDSRVEPKRYAALKERYHASLKKWTDENTGSKVYLGVQCEHCHGNRTGHPGPSFKRVGKVQPKSCTSCHQPPHDPSFNFAERQPKVACPKL